jgi:16S rRNA (cytosine1402-N4)-methyltransferase
VPVLLEEALQLLDVRPGKLYVDATAGGGGHLRAILDKLKPAQIGAVNQESEEDKRLAAQRVPTGSGGGGIIGIDRDLHALEDLRRRFGNEVRLVHSNYDCIKDCLADESIYTVSGGILADLGVSSMQLDDPDRGFSFLRDGPLDMRMDPTQTVTAEHLINTLSEEELANIIFNYGEERFSRAIARAIVRERPLHTTCQLSDVVARSFRHQRWRISSSSKKRQTPADTSHPATRTFQALRIAVNDELNSLRKFLEDAVSLLAPGARLVVITFHSLEDRAVKQFLRHAASSCVCPPGLPVCTCHHQPELLIITRKPIVAGEKEVLANIRSRSAKLRAGEKL